MMRIELVAGVQALIWASVSGQSVQLVTYNSGSTNISSTCVSVINQNVSCDPLLAELGQRGLPYGVNLFLTSTQLSSLCTSACSSSLSTWERRIGGACGTSLWPALDGGQVSLPSIAELYVEVYHSFCLTNL